MAIGHQPSQAEFLRVARGFDDLRAALDTGPGSADRRAEIAAGTAARNDAEIIQGWLEAGLEPLMANGRPVSLPLARMMKLPLTQLSEILDRESA